MGGGRGSARDKQNPPAVLALLFRKIRARLDYAALWEPREHGLLSVSNQSHASGASALSFLLLRVLFYLPVQTPLILRSLL